MTTEQDTPSANVGLSEESAQDQLQILLDYYDLDSEIDSMDPEVEEEATLIRVANRSKARLIKGIRKGLLEITDAEGLSVTQNTPAKSIKYAIVSGNAKIHMEKQTGNHKQMYTLLGYLCGFGAPVFEQMKQPDLGVAEALGALFLLS